jgi:hypothetical protein
MADDSRSSTDEYEGTSFVGRIFNQVFSQPKPKQKGRSNYLKPKQRTKKQLDDAGDYHKSIKKD